MTEYRVEQVGITESELRRDSALLRTVFPTTTHYTEEFLRWEYAENPEGHVVGYNAFSPDGQHAAHYVTQPIRATIHGNMERGLLSFNTATHPSHQGRGLFTLLAQRTFELAARLGFTFVIGVANANSTPGFTRKLGFSVSCQLEARLGMGYCQPQNLEGITFRRVWSADSIRWRLANPAARYYGSRKRQYVDGGKPGLRVQISSTIDVPGSANLGFFVMHPITLWLGAAPHLKWIGASASLPRKLRPSPLNLIFKDLTDSGRTLDAENLLFEAVDFDAY